MAYRKGTDNPATVYISRRCTPTISNRFSKRRDGLDIYLSRRRVDEIMPINPFAPLRFH